MRWAGLAGLFLFACGTEPPPGTDDPGADADADLDSDADADADSDADTDADSDTGSDAGSDADSDSETEPPSPCTEDADSPAVVIGAGGEAWGDLDCDATVPLETIGQGAYHVTLGLKVTGLVFDDHTRIDWEVVESSWGERYDDGPNPLVGDRWTDLGDGWFARFQERAIVTSFDPPVEADGGVVTITAHVYAGDVEVTDTHRLNLVWNY